MNLNELIAEYWQTITLVGGGFFVAYRQFREFQKKELKEKDARNSTIAEREMSYSSRLEERVSRLEEEKERLLRENIELSLAAATLGTPPCEILKSIVENDIGISWVKRRISSENYNMVTVSEGFAREIIGGPKDIVEGQSTEFIFGAEFNKISVASDELVYRNQKGREIEEVIVDSPTGKKGIFIGRKYTIRLPDGHDYIIGSGYLEEIEE